MKQKFEHSWIKEDIIYFKYEDHAVVSLSDVEQMLSLQRQLGVNETTKRIVHAGKYTTITSNARKHIELNKPKAKAEAFIIHGLPQRIMFNMYSKLRRNINPIKSFDSLDKAINWLNDY